MLLVHNSNKYFQAEHFWLQSCFCQKLWKNGTQNCICCKIILTWYLLFVPLNLLTEAKYLILIFVNWNFLHVTYLCDTCQWIPDQWYFLQNARCPHTCSKYLRRESIYYNGWPTKKYTMFNTQKKHIYLSFICTKSPISRLHIAKDIQHIGTIYLVFHV